MIYVYVLRCVDGSLYTGITQNIDERLKQHNRKKVSYTRDKLPVSIIHQELKSSRKEAAKLERYIKNKGAAKYLIQNFAHLHKLSVFL